MKDDPAAIVEPHHSDDVLDLEGVRQKRMAHVFARREGELGLLQMKASLGEPVEIADVIVVEMGNDDVLDVRPA